MRLFFFHFCRCNLGFAYELAIKNMHRIASQLLVGKVIDHKKRFFSQRCNLYNCSVYAQSCWFMSIRKFNRNADLPQFNTCTWYRNTIKDEWHGSTRIATGFTWKLADCNVFVEILRAKVETIAKHANFSSVTFHKKSNRASKLNKWGRERHKRWFTFG